MVLNFMLTSQNYCIVILLLMLFYYHVVYFIHKFIATSALATTKSTITTTAEVPLATEGQDTTEQPEATESSTGESLTTAQPECTGLCPKSLASEDIAEIVRAHNRFRGLVNPPAANMEEMV